MYVSVAQIHLGTVFNDGKGLAWLYRSGCEKPIIRKKVNVKATIEQLILPFKTIALYSKADFRGCFVLYDSHK